MLVTIKGWFNRNPAPTPTPAPATVARTPVPSPVLTNLDIPSLQTFLGVRADGRFGSESKAALLQRFTNIHANALTLAEIQLVATKLGVSAAVIRAVRSVEAPRGAFDSAGRPTALFEKHVFGRQTNYRWNTAYPDLSSTHWQPGTYGPASIQWDRIANACALNPKAAFEAASFGAFQVLGTNAVELGYESAFHMALKLTESELAHLECFEKFIIVNKLVDELRLCRANSPSSCIPFVSKYNGSDYAKNNYHVKFAKAIALYD